MTADSLIPEPTDPFRDALTAVADGWSIVPVGIDKKPLVSWKRYQTTPPDEALVRRWQQQFLPVAWAVITGAISGVIVIDFDGESGFVTFRRLGFEAHVQTGSGGVHLYVRHPGHPVKTLNHKTSRASLGTAFPGTDIRGDGGYAIFTGRNQRGEYVRLRELAPLEYTQLPAELREFLDPPHAVATQRTKPRSEETGHRHESLSTEQVDAAWDDVLVTLASRALELSKADGRNNAGLWLACQLRDSRCPWDEALVGMGAYVGSVGALDGHGEAAPYTWDEAVSSLDSAWSRPPREPWLSPSVARPSIVVNNRQQRDINADVASALANANVPPFVFNVGGTLTRLVDVGEGVLRLGPLTQDGFGALMAEIADFVAISKGDDGDDRVQHKKPDTTALRAVLANSPWDGVPTLARVGDTPIVRVDGTIVDTPGYDAESEIYLTPRAKIEVGVVSDDPAAHEVEEALQLLRDDLLGDFPFADDASYANALGLTLTAILRETIAGLVPLALIDAPQAGTGKSILVSVISMVATGRPASTTSLPRGEDETRKRLTSVLRNQPRLIVLDNVDTSIKHSSLAAAITADIWEDRELGRSSMLSLPQRAVWAATGNNIRVGGDLARRCYWVRLDAQQARPWTRTDWTHPDLLDWTRSNRGRLLNAAFTLYRAWLRADSPAATTPTVASFGQWSRIIGGVLQHAGLEHFLENLEDLYGRLDDDAAEWSVFLTEMRARFGRRPTSAKELDNFTRMGETSLPARLAEHLGRASDEKARQTRIGQLLASIAGRRFDDTGLRIERAPDDPHAKAARWLVLDDNPVERDIHLRSAGG